MRKWLNMTPFKLALCMVICMSCWTPCSSVLWIGGISARWDVGANWDGGNVPTFDSVVEIRSGSWSQAVVQVTITNLPVNIRSLLVCPDTSSTAIVVAVETGSTLNISQGMSVCTGARVRISAGGALVLAGGQSSIHGYLQADGPASSNRASIALSEGARLTIHGAFACGSCQALLGGTVQVFGEMKVRIILLRCIA
jgi:hypothetical protein